MPPAPACRPCALPSIAITRRQLALGLAGLLLGGAANTAAATTPTTTTTPTATPAAEPASGGDGGSRPPRGRVLLTVHSGEGANRREELFDMARLESLPQHAYTTQTPWFKSPKRFSGPLLRDVLAAARAQGTQITAAALNDYKADIPYDDALRHKMLVATRLDGKPMAVRDKGPLFIIYPYDESADLRSERYYSRSVWQLRALSVR